MANKNRTLSTSLLCTGSVRARTIYTMYSVYTTMYILYSVQYSLTSRSVQMHVYNTVVLHCVYNLGSTFGDFFRNDPNG